MTAAGAEIAKVVVTSTSVTQVHLQSASRIRTSTKDRTAFGTRYTTTKKSRPDGHHRNELALSRIVGRSCRKMRGGEPAITYGIVRLALMALAPTPYTGCTPRRENDTIGTYRALLRNLVPICATKSHLDLTPPCSIGVTKSPSIPPGSRRQRLLKWWYLTKTWQISTLDITHISGSVAGNSTRVTSRVIATKF